MQLAVCISTDSVILLSWGFGVEFVLNVNIKLSWVDFCLDYIDISGDRVSWVHFKRLFNVKDCLFPVGLLFVRRC